MTPKLEISKGVEMPILGLGTWLSENEEELSNALNKALDAGYRHFDTAYVYRNEAIIGKTFKKWFESGKIKREELFIVTKLPICAIKAEKVAPYLEKSLEALQLDYVDQYLIHVPFGLGVKDDDFGNPIPIGADGKVVIDKGTDHGQVWLAMENLLSTGKAKSIGVSNFDEDQIERIMKVAKIPPAVLQIELHVYYQQKSLRDVCNKHGIKICAYSPLGSPGQTVFYKQFGQSYKENGLLSDPIVMKIASKYGKTSAQICLRFLVQQDIIAIPKATHEERLKENIQIFDFQLNIGEMYELQSLDKGLNGRTMTFSKFLPGIEDHPEFPKNMK